MVCPQPCEKQPAPTRSEPLQLGGHWPKTGPHFGAAGGRYATSMATSPSRTSAGLRGEVVGGGATAACIAGGRSGSKRLRASAQVVRGTQFGRAPRSVVK